LRIPNAERAFVDMRKLERYCLDAGHPRGKNKARVFASSLGFTGENSQELQELLIEAATREDAEPARRDAYGQRYMVQCVMEGPNGRARVNSIWIIRQGEDFPRLVTCYVM